MRKLITIIIFFLTIALCKGQSNKNTLDTLLKVIEENRISMVGHDTYRFNILFNIIYSQERIAAENIEIAKTIFSRSKKINKIEVAYKKTQASINLYIDSLSSYFKDYPTSSKNFIKGNLEDSIKYDKDYKGCNKKLKIALLSIRKLNKLFKKYNSSNSSRQFFYIIEKRSSIKKVVSYTMYWKHFLFFYDKKHDAEGFLSKPKLYYWTRWEDINNKK